MWTLEKKFSFEASHILPHHSGKCARLHGHSWKGTLVCSGKSLKQDGSEQGMLIDFSRMSAITKKLTDTYLDHYHLNDSLGLENPTSEEVARWIYEKVKPELPDLRAVIIEETCTSLCRYEPYMVLASEERS